MPFLDETGLSHFWQQILTKLGSYVPTTRKVNNKTLNSDISLTASDVGALPSTTTSLKNPNALKFTGASTGTYDGSSELTINIPTSSGGSSITVDSALSSTSTNPVQNKVIKAELDQKLPLSGGTLTGNLSGKYLIGTWLQTTAASELSSAPEKIAVLDSSGLVYYRTLAHLKSDLGVESLPTVTTSDNGKFLRVVNGAWTASTIPSAEEASF